MGGVGGRRNTYIGPASRQKFALCLCLAAAAEVNKSWPILWKGKTVKRDCLSELPPSRTKQISKDEERLKGNKREFKAQPEKQIKSEVFWKSI